MSTASETYSNSRPIVSGVGISLREVIHPADEQYFLAYLPLAVRPPPHLLARIAKLEFQHCLEFIVEIGIIYLGVRSLLAQSGHN